MLTKCYPATQDHPRVGGEKTKSIHPYPVLDGSPPHGRGKEAQDRAFAAARRITPAWAGKSRCSSAKGKAVQNHPRVGGEKNKELEGVWLPMGSPPRRRGKVVHCAAVRALRGITPRVGGEKPFLFCGGSSDSGSPPHRRGKVRRIRENLERVGITPAWAGKSWQSGNRLCFTWDHPRMGGEKSFSISSTYCATGSPPHGRGKY